MTEQVKQESKMIKVEILVNDFLQEYKELQLLSPDEQRSSIIELIRERFKGAEQLQKIDIIDQNAEIKWYYNPGNPEADQLNQQALAYMKANQVPKAIEYWQKAIDINPIDPDYHYNLGLGYFSNKQPEKGIDSCLEAIRICPVYYRAYFVLGSVFSRQKEYDKAEEFTRSGLLLNRKNIQALINLGALYSILKKYDDAIKCFDRVLEVSPKEAKAYLGLGKIYHLKNDSQNALRYFRAVTKASQDQAMIDIAEKMVEKLQSQLTQVTTKDNDSNTEKTDTDQSITKTTETEPENVELLYGEGYQSFIDGNFEKCEEKYAEYLKWRVTDVDVWAALASCQARMGKFDQAIQSINKAIAYESDNRPMFFKQSAIIYDAASEFEKSGQAARNAFELGKQDSTVLTLIGKSLFKQEKINESLNFLEDAVKLNNYNITARYYLGKALKVAGQTDRAVQNFEEVIWSKYNSPLKQKARNEIDKIMS